MSFTRGSIDAFENRNIHFEEITRDQWEDWSWQQRNAVNGARQLVELHRWKGLGQPIVATSVIQMKIPSFGLKVGGEPGGRE
jgi:hypothetical protein